MRDFTFYSPTRVYFGKGAEGQAGQALSSLGAKKVLLHYGGGSAERSGLLGRLRDSLKAAGLSYTELGGVQPNPVLSLVRRGVALALSENVDFILAVGGGSVLDSAKAISLGAANPEADVWDFFLRKAAPKARLPVAGVVTIAAAGSEMSDSAVITKEEGLVKRGLNHEFNRPVAAFMNPALLATLPKEQIGAGCADILMHTLERYFTDTLGNELTDRIAEAVLKTVIRFSPAFLANPGDYDAASEIMWAGSLSHNQLTGLGGRQDFATHQLGIELSGLFDATHGATLTATWGSWARFVHGANPARFARYAANVWGEEYHEGSEARAALAGIRRTEEFFRSLGMPVSIKELLGRALTEEELKLMSEKCTHFGARKIGSFKALGYPEIYEIYREANG